jgi:hypothetical protein
MALLRGKAHPLAVAGQPLSGRAYAQLAGAYCDAINGGAVPQLVTAWQVGTPRAPYPCCCFDPPPNKPRWLCAPNHHHPTNRAWPAPSASARLMPPCPPTRQPSRATPAAARRTSWQATRFGGEGWQLAMADLLARRQA